MFPSQLSVLILGLLLGSFSPEDNSRLVSSVAFYSVYSHQKKFHICPCSHLYIQWFDFKFQNGMLGSHSYGKSPVTSSNKSCSAFRMVVQATKLCSLCFLLGSPSISKSSTKSHSGSASVSWQNQIKQCFILWWQAFFHISVGCSISRLDIKRHYKSPPNQSKCEPANHEQFLTRISVSFQCWSPARADCRSPMESNI